MPPPCGLRLLGEPAPRSANSGHAPETLDPDHVVALLVYGPDISKSVLEMMSIQFELFCEELDREQSGADSAQFTWKTLDPSFAGNRVLVAPHNAPRGAGRTIETLLDRARRGISTLTRRPKRPPGFTRLALEHLEWIARAITSVGVDRVVFFAGGIAETISQATLNNLQTLNEDAGPGGKNDIRRR